MITKKQLEKGIEEMKKFAKEHHEPVDEYLDYDIAQATLTQTNEIIKLIEDLKKKNTKYVQKILIEDSEEGMLSPKMKKLIKKLLNECYKEFLTKIKGDDSE